MSDIDEYLQSRKLKEAEEALAEAKRRLEDERSHLKNEQKKVKAKETKHKEAAPDDDADEPRGSSDGGYSIQPWMLWNLIILALVLILFGVSMFYPKAPTVDMTQVEALIDQKVAAAETASETKIKALEEDLKEDEEETAAEALARLKEEDDEETTTGPKFMLNVENDDGSTIGDDGSVEIINGTEGKYVLIVQNKEKTLVRCDADRTVNGETKKGFFKALKLAAGEKEDLPQEVANVEKEMNIQYDFSCYFDEEPEDRSEQSIDFKFIFTED